MRDIGKEIQENLDAIEERYNVKILLAVESGSRAWGFASPDSDYDVRFIYMHRPEEYLRIDAMKDVIEWQLDEVLDINGWDLRKALLAFGKGNPNVMEHGFLSGDMVRYKKYFYALRPLLCCRWIERYHSVPPMEFEKLLTMFSEPDDVLTQELYDAIQELLRRKAETEEKDLNPQMPAVISFIREECVRQKRISDAAADDHRRDYSELNEAFRAVVWRCTA